MQKRASSLSLQTQGFWKKRRILPNDQLEWTSNNSYSTLESFKQFVSSTDGDIEPSMLEPMSNITFNKSVYFKKQAGHAGVIQVQGELLKSDCDVIIHCCNCFHTMGARIAKTIKQLFPEAFTADCATPYGSIAKLGHFSAGFSPSTQKTIVNLYGQHRYGKNSKVQYVSYDALRVRLQRLLKVLRYNQVTQR